MSPVYQLIIMCQLIMNFNNDPTEYITHVHIYIVCVYIVCVFILIL